MFELCSHTKELFRSPLVRVADEFAEKAHYGQARRYSRDEPYIAHPRRVARLVATTTMKKEIVAAALLHDVVEDCEKVTIEHIRSYFGEKVAEYVAALTCWNGDKERYNQQLALNPDVHSIKLADIIDNLSPHSMRHAPEDFQKRYKAEKAAQLEYLTNGNLFLLLEVKKLLTLR